MNNTPVPLRRPPELVRLQYELGLSHDDFTACRKLIALVEAAAPALTELDRTHVARLLYSTAHAISLIDQRERR